MQAFLFSIVGVAVLSLTGLAAETAEDLVKRLGDKSFRERSGAALRLVALGPKAIPAIQAGTNDPDPEISGRCRQLLAQLETQERNHKLELLLRDPTASPPDGMAGLKEFLKITGDTKPARELYAELMREHHGAMEMREKDFRAATALFNDFCASVAKQHNNTSRPYDLTFSRADLTLCFVFGADRRVNDLKGESGQYYLLMYGDRLKSRLSEIETGPAMKKLFLSWLEDQPESFVQVQVLDYVAKAKIIDLQLSAVRMIQREDVSRRMKAGFMPLLLQSGAKENIKLLKPFLSDTWSVGYGNGKGDEHTVIQMRDLAMGLSVQLLGMDPVDFGFFRNRFSKGKELASNSYGFASNEAREAAHTKWNDWVTKNAHLLLFGEQGPAARVVSPEGSGRK